jgi:hypothetical protein
MDLAYLLLTALLYLAVVGLARGCALLARGRA